MHIHLIANRIGIDGSVYDTTFLGNRSARIAEEISRKIGLTVANEVQRQKEYQNRYADPKREAAKAELRRIAYEELGKGHPDFRKFYMAMLKNVYHPPVVEAFKKYVIEQAQKEWDYKTS